MKKICSVLLAVMLLLLCAAPVHATDTSREFLFELTADGGNEKKVQTGDIITVVFTLYRTDSEEDYTMLAMQNEIRYDSNFFKLVEGSAMLSDGISTTEIGLRDHYREFYMNFVSLFGGETWKAKRIIGSFQLEVIATSGVSKITNEDYLVSAAGGKDTYRATCQDVTIIVSTECTVTFESNGGTQVSSQNVLYGEKIACPAEPVREGYHLVGWYTDIDLQKPWNFDEDIVRGNMTLYAKWEKGDPVEPGETTPTQPDPPIVPDSDTGDWLTIALIAMLVMVGLLLLLVKNKKTIRFETNCEMKVKEQKVKKGGYVQRPEELKREGKTFAGWFCDAECTMRWNFEADPVKDHMILYAKWIG